MTKNKEKLDMNPNCITKSQMDHPWFRLARSPITTVPVAINWCATFVRLHEFRGILDDSDREIPEAWLPNRDKKLNFVFSIAQGPSCDAIHRIHSRLP